MKSTSIAVVLTLGLFPALAVEAVGQAEQPTVEHVLESIQGSGSISSTLSRVAIQTCPQDDAYDREMVDALAPDEMPPRALAELGLLWRTPFAMCEYAPLDAWFESALTVLAQSDDLAPYSTFVRHIAPVLSDDLREIIWQSIETRGFGSEFALSLATTATDGGVGGDQRIVRSLQAFRVRDVPTGWIEAQSAALARDEPVRFLEALGAASSTLSDDRLGRALSGIDQMIQRGHLDAQLGQLGVLRGRVRDRDGIPVHLRELRRRQRQGLAARR